MGNNLPSGYKELQYIQSSGTQYIQLNYGFYNTDEVEIKSAIISDTPTSINDTYMVAPSSWNTASNRFAMGGVCRGHKTVGYGAAGTDSTPYTPTIAASTDVFIETYKDYVFTCGDSTCDVSNLTFGTETTNLKLFYGYNVCKAGKIYYWKHWKVVDGTLTLVENLIPAIQTSNSEVGMYDTVSGEFYGNDGSGVFIAGPSVETEYSCYQKKITSGTTFDKTKVTTTGTPSITDAGIYTTTSSESYIRTEDTLPFSTASTWSFKWKFTYTNKSTDQGIMCGNGGTNVQAIINNTGKPRMSFGSSSSGWYTGGIWNETTGSGTTLVSFNYVNGTTYSNEIRFTGTEYQFWVDGVELGYCSCSTKASDTYFAIGVERGHASSQYTKCTWDLTETSITLDGVEYFDWMVPTTYTCYKAQLTVGTPRLPSAYQEIEYIESSGTQYIDTGYYANQNTELGTKYNYTNTSGSYVCIFGGETNYTTNAFHIYTGGSYLDIGFGVSRNDFNVPKNTSIVEYTANKNGLSAIINGTTYGGTYTTSDFTSPYSTYLFAMNRGSGAAQFSSARLYYFQLSENGTIVRNMIPCKRVFDSKPGMYNLCWDKSKYGYVDLGTLTWAKSTFGSQSYKGFYATIDRDTSSPANMYIEGYATLSSLSEAGLTKAVTGFNHTGRTNNICIYDIDCEDMTVAEFKAAMSGVMLSYQRTTDTSFESPFYTNAGTGTFTAGSNVNPTTTYTLYKRQITA